MKKKYMRKSADHGANVLEGTVKGIMKEGKGERLCQGRRLQRTLEMRIKSLLNVIAYTYIGGNGIERSSASNPSGVLRGRGHLGPTSFSCGLEVRVFLGLKFRTPPPPLLPLLPPSASTGRGHRHKRGWQR